jgi:hypothetical protein
MRRLTMAITALALAWGLTAPMATEARADELDCTDYCGQRAAIRCDSIDSWECGWYIAGCLAGCNLRNL